MRLVEVAVHNGQDLAHVVVCENRSEGSLCETTHTKRSASRDERWAICRRTLQTLCRGCRRSQGVSESKTTAGRGPPRGVAAAVAAAASAGRLVTANAAQLVPAAAGADGGAATSQPSGSELASRMCSSREAAGWASTAARGPSTATASSLHTSTTGCCWPPAAVLASCCGGGAELPLRRLRCCLGCPWSRPNTAWSSSSRPRRSCVSGWGRRRSVLVRVHPDSSCPLQAHLPSNSCSPGAGAAVVTAPRNRSISQGGPEAEREVDHRSSLRASSS